MESKKLVLKVGSTGDLVKVLQELLSIKPIDGEFGVNTRSSVIFFQKNHNLVGDGIVGPMTWKALNYNPEELYADTDTLTSATWIERHHLPEGEYVNIPTSKKYIFLHHTAGRHNPYNVINEWAADQRGRIGTNYVIGGLPAHADANKLAAEDSKFNGRILQAIDDLYWGYHLGPNGSTYMTQHSLSIEICNAGALTKKGNDYFTWYGEKVHPSQVVKLENSFRGFTYFHKYSQAQLEALEALIYHLKEKHAINIVDGMKKLGPEEMYNWHENIWKGAVNGVLSHSNVRKDKNDVFPQPELTKLIMSLK